MGYLHAVEETNKVKAESRTATQVIFGLLLFATPAGLVWWLALLDGIPFFGHVKGSWGIALPPEFVQDFHTVVQSFFIAAPALAGVAMLARVFRK
jgi:hypothetical protein